MYKKSKVEQKLAKFKIATAGLRMSSLLKQKIDVNVITFEHEKIANTFNTYFIEKITTLKENIDQTLVEEGFTKTK